MQSLKLIDLYVIPPKRKFGDLYGKRKFGYDIGAVLSVKYIAEHPPKGCEWMTDKAFVAKVVKYVIFVKMFYILIIRQCIEYV